MLLRKTKDGQLLLENVPQRGVQKINARAVEAGIEAGTHTLTDDAIVLHTSNHGDVAFMIQLLPGQHCLFDDHYIGGDPTGQQMRDYIADNFPGQESPDPDHPAGYLSIAYYLTTLQPADVEVING